MNDFLSSFLNKISNKVTRRKTTKWNKNQIKLDLLKLEERLVPAPNLVVPTTTSGAPLGFVQNTNLAFSGALDIELLDTPTPASNGNFTTTVATTAGTASATASGAAVVSGSGTNALTIAGNLADVNATLNSLTYTNSTTGAASLVVTASDSAGTPLTDTKTIYVNAANSATAPTITTALANVAYYAEATSVTEAAISFTVSDPQGTTGVVVTGTSSNTNLILNSDITIAGTYPNFTVALKHQANITGTALITLKVSDGTNFTTKSFNVSVAPTAQYYWDIVAGNGTAGITNGTGTAATFNGPWQIAVDSVNNLYVGDYNSGTIRMITPAGVVTTIAGSATVGYLDNANPLIAKFNKPRGVAVDNNGNVYVSEDGGYIRKIAYNSGNGTYGPVSTLASSLGSTTTSWGMLVVTPDGSTVYVAKVSDKKIYKIDTANNTGAALTAAFGAVPMGLSFDNNGNLLVREMTTGFTYQVTPAGVVTTLNSSVQYGNAQAIQLADGSYLSALNATISRISMPNKAVVVGGGGTAGALGLGAVAGFGDIRSIVDAPNGFIYVSDWSATQNKIRVGKPYPSLLNPGTQSTLEATRLAFSSANLTQLGALANASDNSNVKLALTYTLSVDNGTLDFNNVAAPVGVTVTFSADRRSVTLVGAEAAINTYMLNFGYTPDANYINANMSGGALASGAIAPDVLSLTVTTANNINAPVTGSLNLVVRAANNTPRIITALPDKVYLVGSVTTTETAIDLIIADADTAATAFMNNATTGARITATSDNPNLILPADIALAIGGTTNARTFTVKHQANITGVANITITIADAQGNQSTYTFKVTVKAAPSYYWGTLTTNAGGSQITKDSNGDLIAADFATGAIWRITPQGVSTLLKSGFSGPLGVAIDANKNLFVSEPGALYKVPYNSGTNTYGTKVVLVSALNAGEILLSPDGTTLYCGKSYSVVKVNVATGAVSDFVGSGVLGSADGTGLNATFNFSKYLAWDNNGNILVAQANGPVRLVTLAGVVTTLPLFQDAASLSPHQNTIVQTRDGNYVGMVSAPRVSVSTPDGNSVVVSGTSGFLDGLNTEAKFNSQRGGVATPDGKVYISDGTYIRVGTLYPSLLNPGTQATLDGVRLAFSNANLAQLGAFANDTDMSLVRLPITYTLSAQFGTLDFNNVAVPAGVTVTFSADRRSVTLVGAEAAINTYMLNFGYTPDANYINANMSGGALASGAIAPDVLSLTVTTANNTNDPVTGSLNLVVKAADPKPKIITALPDRQYYVENAIATETAFTFTIADADTATFTNNASTGSRITVTSDNPNLILPADMATAIGGTGINRTFTVKHQANITGVANVTITINDGTNQNTYTFKVTVVPTPSYYWNILAGSSAGTAGTTNATGTSASFSGPSGLVKDSQGNYFVTDTTNNLIRKITPQGMVTTFAGFGGVGAFLDGAGTAAKFNSPQGLAIDSSNNLYVADFGNNRIRKIDTAGNVTTIAGTGVASSLDGAALSATMRGPTGIAVDSTGTVYWTDKTTSVIRKLQGGQVTTIAGSSGLTGTTDGTGNIARFNLPTFLTINNAGNLVVNDATNLSYRQVTPAGVVTTLFNYTSGATAVGVDAQGNLYAGLSSNTLSLISSFDTTTIMGTGTAGSAIAVNTAATVGSTRQMVFLSDGTIVIADNTRNNIRVGTPIPSLMNPGKQIVLADQLLTFDNAALEGLGIQSNGYPEPLSITLTVTKGVFSLSQTTGLTFATGDGTNDITMTFTGSMANINTAITGLVYNFDEVAYPSITADTLTISTPYTVGGVTSTISQVVPIQIVKPPVITVVADKLVNLGSAISAATFTVTDADTAANALTYTITSSNTALVANSGLVRTGGTGATGTVAPANAANSLAITAVTGRTGTTTITISVFDGAITTATTFSVTVSPIVGAPDLVAASDTGTSTTDNLTSDTTPTFAVSIGGSSGIQVGDVVAIYNGTTKIGEAVVTAADILAGSIQVTTSALADGNYSNITSSVIFGTTRGAISAPLSPALVIDATAPSANGLPDLTSASDTGASSTDNVTNNTTPSFTIPITGSGAIIGDKVELYSGTTLIGTVTLIASDIAGGSATVVVSPALAAGTYSDIKYRLVDTAGNTSSFSGSMSPALVIDLSAPTLVTLNPADDATNLVPPTTLVMTLSEALSKGTGSIIIKKTSDNSVVETFNVATSGRVMVSNSTVTITPSVTLAYGTGYYVTVASTALLDLAGNAYAGLANTTDWNFTTLSTPPSPTGVDLVAASDSGSSSTDNKTNKTDITLDVALANGSQVGDVIKLYDGTTVVGTVTLTANDITAGKVSFNLVSQTDGTHSYKATLSNNAGESAPTSVLSTIIDTSLPGAPTITPVGTPTSNTTPTLSGTAEAGATVTVVIDGSSVTVIADNSGNWSYPIPAALAEGSHTVVVTQTDVAGNIGIASNSASFVVDTTAPIATTFSPADGTTVSKPSVLSITFNEAIALGSTGTITIYDDTNNTSQVISLPNANITVSGNTLTILPTTALIGGVNYHVEISSGAIKDLAGNAYAGISNATDWNFTTNNAPSSPSGVDLQSVSDSGTSNSDNKTNATALNFDVPIPAGAVVGDVIKLYDGGIEVGSITILDSTMLTAGTVTFNLPVVTSGSHSYTSTLTNTGSGLTSSPSPALVVDVNNTLPSAPVITPLAITKNQTPTISGTAPANSTVTLTIGTGAPVTVTTDANGNWNYTPTTPLTQGTYVISATATDLYGNISLVSAPTNLVIDTTAPTKPIITGIGPDNGVSNTDKITNANVLTIAGTAEANSLVTVYDNGTKIGTTTTDANGVWTFTTAALTDGSNRFSANATDSAGNKSVNADSYTMVVDASAPTAPVINSLPSPIGDNTPTISGTGEPGAVVTINANGSPIGTAVVDANGNWSFTPTTPISDGTTAFTATQKDTAGNNSPTSNTVTTVIDTTAPNAPAINNLGTINSATPAITGNAEPGSTIKLYNGTTLIGTATADSNGNWSITPSPALNEGTNNLIATATDPSGNISPTSSPVVAVVDTVAPISTSFSPATGSASSSIFENLVINFSEAVALGSSGTIELRDSNGVLIESFSISSNRLTLSGNSLTIDPTANLTLGTGYYVTMTAGTIKDLAGNAFAGVTNNSDWAFTTSSLAIPPAPSGVNLQAGSDTGSSNTDNITSDNTPTFDIALNPSGLNVGDVVHLYDNGVDVGSVILTAADIAAGKVAITSSALADGVHSLTSKIEDAIGTLSAASPALSVSIITQPPAQAGTPDLAAASDTGSSSTDNITAIKIPTFNGTGTPGETVSLFVDGVLAGVGVVDSNGNYSITASTPIADGVHAITTQYTNIAGISGAVSTPLSLTVDSTPPATPTTPADMTSATDTGRSNTDNLTSDTTPDFSGSGLTPGNTVVLYVDGQPAGTAVVDANGNWTATVSPALSDGSHTVTYLVNDLAGNASGFAPTMNITVDTAVPAKPSVPTLDPTSDTGLSSTDGITRDNTPTINGTGGTPGFDVTLKDGNGNIIGTAIVAADGTWSITPTSSLIDGTYNFKAEYTSISGVTGPASDPITVVIDTVAPSAPAAPTISTINPSATAGHTNSTTPVFEGTGLTPGNLVELFDGNTKVGSAIVGANGNYQIISSTLADGAHSFTVKVTDAAGNTSGASTPTSLIIDSRVPGSPTTPDLTPATDTGASNSDNITNNNTPVFKGVVDLNSSAIAGDFVEIYSGNTLVGVGIVVLNNGVLEWSVTVGSTASGYTGTALGATTLANGTTAISAKFLTPGGTPSASSQALTVVVDTIAPAAPSGAPDLAASSDTGNSSTDNLTNDTTPTFTGTGGVPGDTVNLYANGTLVGTATVAPDGSYSVSVSPAITDGTYAFTTKYEDPAGNLSSASSPINVTIDSTPPAVPPTPDLIAAADTGASNFDNLTSENQPTFEGFGTTGDTIKIYVDGVLAGTTTVDANGNWSITTNSIADGVHQITSQAIDPAGNASAQSTPLVLTIDSSAPNSPIFTTTSGPTSNAQPPISGTGEPGSTITLYDGTTPIGTAIVNANGSWSITPSSPLAEGTHTFTTTATDGAGNISLPSSPIAVTIDTTKPLPPVIASVSQDTGNPNDKITSDNTLTITGTAEPGTTITVYDNGSPVGTVVVGANGTYSVTTSVLSDGSHPLSITSTDPAGNQSQPAPVGTYTIDTGTPTAPTFGSVSQDTGASAIDKITSDNTLTVTGAAGSAEPGTTITIYDNGIPVGIAVVASDGSYSVTTSVLSDGNHPLTITSTDAAGNQSNPTSIGTWAIDTTAPNAPAFGSVTQDTGASATDKITSDNTLTIAGAAGSAEPGTTINVYDNTSGTPVLVGTATVQSNGSYSVTTSVLSDGNHPLSITATDAAGNQSSPTSLGTWTIDTVAPNSPVVTSVSDDTGRSNSDKITSDNTLTVTGNAQPNSLVTIYGYIHNSFTNTDTTRVVVGTGYADANGNYAVTTNPLPDNALNEKYVLSVTATDAAGMESPATSIGAWAISTSIPNPPVVTSVSQDTGSSSTDKLTNDTTLTVTGTGTPGTTITIYDGNTPVGTGLVDANGNYAVTTSALANGPHALSASATNPFGFEGLSTQLGTWTVDTVAPIQPTLAANNGLPLVSGLANSAEPGSTVSVVIGGATYSAIVDGTGAWSINLATAIPTSGSAPALATGTFPISVFSTDAAGNSTTPVVSNLVVTTIGQPAPTISSNPSTSDTTPLISGNSEIGSTVTVTIRDANNVVIATYSNVPTNSNGTWALDLQTAIPNGGTTPIPALVNGNSYNLSATATDANNQFTSVPTTQKLVIDTTAPNRPVITSPAITNDTTPLFTGTAEPGTVIELTIKRANGTSITIYQTVTSPIDPNNPTAPGTWSIDFSQISPSAGFLNDLADGNYIVEVVAIDAAFNRSTAATQNPFIVDTVAPAAPVITSPSLTNDNTPVLAGTAEPGSTVTVVINGFTYTTTALSPSGAWSVNLQTAVPVGGSTPITALTDGVHTVTITATDPAGNTSAPTTQNLRVDTTPPAVPQITSSNKNNDTTPVITGLAEPGSTVVVTINGSTFNTTVSPNGTWSVDLGTAIPNGGTTPIAPLVTGNSYPISVTATDAAGNTSAPATQTLAIDTSAPISPTITSPALTNQVPPTVTGTAEPGSTVTLTINGATFTTPVDANGNWTVNTATATPTSGALGTFTDGPYPISVYSTNGFNNQSGTSTQTLTVDRTPPVIVGALASFGGNLNLDESKLNAIVSVNISGIEDGRIVTVTLNGLTYTGTVYNGKVDITIPAAILSNLADGSSQTLTVSANDLAGNPATPYQVPFTVDKTGPARPSFVSITSTSTDPNPADPFTGVVNPTVVISGQAGQTIVIHGPNGIVDPSNYTVVDNNGLYTITFTTNQTSGNYQVNLRDANGNENTDGPGAQNFFNIDSIPVLYDMPNKRSTAQGSTFGNLGVKNTLNGQSFDVPQQADNTWIDLDGETLTFGLAGSTVVERDPSNNPTLIEASINGASLKIDPRTGAYTYTPVSNTNRLDTFFVTIRDTSGNQTQLKLVFNSRDTLDRDGIGSVSESVLAGLVNQSGNATNLLGDLNQDGLADSQQNSVSTLAWRKESDFQTATDSNTAANTDPTAIICIVVNATAFDPATTTTLTQLMGNVDPLAQILQVSVSGLSSVAADASKYYKPWDIMNFSVESLVSTGLNDVNATRVGTQIQVSIDISKANIPVGGSGFTLYRKFVSANIISDYADAGITLTDLDGNIITTAGWFDYTQRTPGGDGAIGKDFNNDGKIDAIIITLTDNAFGDDSPIRNTVVDPITPTSNFPPNPGGANPTVPTPPGSNPPSPAPTSFAATGTSTGSVPGTTVNIYPTSTTTPSAVLVPFANWQGEVRIVRADINADGNLETIATMGEGGLPILRVFDGVTGLQTMEIQVYDRAFTGGIFVAIGDLGNDGILDIVTGAGNSGGPHIKIFNAITGSETSSFMAYDINFRGGVSVAVGDIDGSGFAAIVTGAGPGGGPHVKVFNGTDHSLIKQFMAYASTFTGGVYVAVGDYLSDGKYEIITGAGVGGGPHIKIWDYETLNLDGQTMAFTDFTKPNGEVIDVIFTGGVRVALADANGDNVLDILAGAGPTGGPRVEVFVGFRLELLMDFFTGDKNDGRGVFVSQ